MSSFTLAAKLTAFARPTKAAQQQQRGKVSRARAAKNRRAVVTRVAAGEAPAYGASDTSTLEDYVAVGLAHCYERVRRTPKTNGTCLVLYDGAKAGATNAVASRFSSLRSGLTTELFGC